MKKKKFCSPSRSQQPLVNGKITLWLLEKLKSALLAVDSLLSRYEQYQVSAINCAANMGEVINFPGSMDSNTTRPKRKRSMTSIALSWLSERMNRADELKKAISDGTYQVPIDQVAKAIVKPDNGTQAESDVS